MEGKEKPFGTCWHTLAPDWSVFFRYPFKNVISTTRDLTWPELHPRGTQGPERACQNQWGARISREASQKFAFSKSEPNNKNFLNLAAGRKRLATCQKNFIRQDTLCLTSSQDPARFVLFCLWFLCGCSSFPASRVKPSQDHNRSTKRTWSCCCVFSFRNISFLGVLFLRFLSKKINCPLLLVVFCSFCVCEDEEVDSQYYFTWEVSFRRDHKVSWIEVKMNFQLRNKLKMNLKLNL